MGTPTVADVPLFTGKVISFEESRGYGFIAPDRGGEDVFLHVNALPTDSDRINCGTRLKFRVADGGRGPKAYDVRLFDASAAVASTPTTTVAAEETDVTCDVLSEQEFLTEVTELILAADATVSACQVLALRRALCTFARSHAWLD